MEPFCTRLKQIRGKESQASFARKIGVSQVAYGRYELGIREPDIATLTRIGLVAHVSIDWLLGVSDKFGESAADARKFQALKEALKTILAEYS